VSVQPAAAAGPRASPAARPSGPPAALRRVVYLGGLGRSGSTLLERLLGELPGACSAGELVHLWQRGIVEGERCGCGQPFADCEFWRAVGQDAFGGWAAVDTDRIAGLRHEVDRTRSIPLLAGPGLRPAARGRVTEYGGYYLRLYAALARVSGSGVVVDSSKHASLAFCLRHQPGLDLRVVHIVRDSRAVAYSWTKKVSRPDSAAATFMTTYSPAAAAGHWNIQNQALQWLAARGTPVLRIRYEDLVAAPAATLTRVAAFAGLAAGPRELSFLDPGGEWAQLHAAHTASGNPMRFRTGRIDIRRDEKWRFDMPAGHRRLVTALTLPLLARYGYPRRPA
jgi:sulfotransferase family protein